MVVHRPNTSLPLSQHLDKIFYLEKMQTDPPTRSCLIYSVNCTLD
jgi:hypothetical protein